MGVNVCVVLMFECRFMVWCYMYVGMVCECKFMVYMGVMCVMVVCGGGACEYMFMVWVLMSECKFMVWC